MFLKNQGLNDYSITVAFFNGTPMKNATIGKTR